MNEDQVLVTEKDYLRIKNLLPQFISEDLENLEIELDRAKIISDNEVPTDLVTMNTKFKYINDQSNMEFEISLVYPQQANFNEGKISILAPLGYALLGLRVGQKINWKFPDGKTKTLRISEVLYQPERSGDWHL